jgi:hypothetical protein
MFHLEAHFDPFSPITDPLRCSFGLRYVTRLLQPPHKLRPPDKNWVFTPLVDRPKRQSL